MTDFRKEAEDFASQFVDGEIGRKVFADLVQRFLRSAYERGVEAARSASVPEDVAELVKELRETTFRFPRRLIDGAITVDSAADTIEAQAAEIARLKDEVSRYKKVALDNATLVEDEEARAEAAEARVAELTKDRCETTPHYYCRPTC